MAKFYGVIGYANDSQETALGVHEEALIRRRAYGDILRNNRKLENGEGLNDDLALNNQISILADAYAVKNFFSIRYVEWMGAKWKVTNVEVQPPRLILTIGGVYNGPTGWVTHPPV